jgi:hypothetical protein
VLSPDGPHARFARPWASRHSELDNMHAHGLTPQQHSGAGAPGERTLSPSTSAAEREESVRAATTRPW